MSNQKKDRNDRRTKQSMGTSESAFEEKVVEVNRVSRTVKGGKRMRFRVLVVIGNRQGKVGIGIGKAQEVITAVKKAVNHAKKDLINVTIIKGTIPHETTVNFGSAKLFLKPARAGTSVIAGSSVRTVLELAGIKNILSKILGTSNKMNNAKATILALKNLRAPEEKEANTKIEKVEHETS